MGNIKEHQEKKYRMVNDYMLDEVLHKIKETIGNANFSDTKILIDADYKLPDYTLKDAVILIACNINSRRGFRVSQVSRND